MLLILEGVDGAGKSTLASELEKEGYKIVHRLYNPDYADFSQAYEDLLLEISEPTVLDRSFISEIVYGQVLRQHSRLSLEALSYLLKIASMKMGKVLYCYAPSEVIRSRLKEPDNEHENVLRHLAQLIDAYKHLMKQISQQIPIIYIDTSLLSPAETVLNLRRNQLI